MKKKDTPFNHNKKMRKTFYSDQYSTPYFSFLAILPHLLLTIALIYTFHFLQREDLFPVYQDKIHLAIKILLVIILFFGSAKSIFFPLITLIAGGLDLFALQYQLYQYAWISSTDAWQLIIASVIGMILALLKR